MTHGNILKASNNLEQTRDMWAEWFANAMRVAPGAIENIQAIDSPDGLRDWCEDATGAQMEIVYYLYQQKLDELVNEHAGRIAVQHN